MLRSQCPPLTVSWHPFQHACSYSRNPTSSRCSQFPVVRTIKQSTFRRKCRKYFEYWRYVTVVLTVFGVLYSGYVQPVPPSISASVLRVLTVLTVAYGIHSCFWADTPCTGRTLWLCIAATVCLAGFWPALL